MPARPDADRLSRDAVCARHGRRAVGSPIAWWRAGRWRQQWSKERV